ncbi:MAG: DUF1269 domain-containing protein [Gammaproteobacteria bacterium]|nr:DUF1269 domain-containing protein [Gammaproteobacteria bacterium]
MKRRLYFLTPDNQTARQAHDRLLLSRIPEKDMHVIAREDVDTTDLPQANLLQKTDLVHAMQLGGTIGGLLGAVMAAVASLMGWVAIGLEGMTILSTAIAGVFIGTVSASMIGINIPNTRHARFQNEIHQGKILFIVDIPVEEVDRISEMVSSTVPNSDIQGIDPTIPAFP